MRWGRLDDALPDHPKLLRVGPIGLALHIRALCYCFRHLTDGFIPREALPQLLAGFDTVALVEGQDRRQRLRYSRRATEVDWPGRMLAAGIWEPRDDGWFIHDYLSYQLSAADIKAEQDRQRRAGLARAQGAPRGPRGRFLSQPNHQPAGPAVSPATAGHDQPMAGTTPPAAGWSPPAEIQPQYITEQDREALFLSSGSNGATSLTPEQVKAGVHDLVRTVLRPRP